jgi:hypothetical protein
MRAWRAIWVAWFMLLVPSCVAAPDMDRRKPIVIRDSFTNGNPELDWRPYPYFNQDNLKGEIDPSSPEGEPGVGVLSNGTAGGFAALSYAETVTFGDFSLEAWLYVQSTENEKGPLNGIAFRVDPIEDRYYRFSAHFSADPSLSLAYVGKDTNHFPVILGEWKGASLPRGTSLRGGWHRVGIEVRNNAVEIIWDSMRLSGGPFRLDRVASGYIGVYATYTGGRGFAETKIDGLRVGR